MKQDKKKNIERNDGKKTPSFFSLSLCVSKTTDLQHRSSILNFKTFRKIYEPVSHVSDTCCVYMH